MTRHKRNQTESIPADQIMPKVRGYVLLHRLGRRTEEEAATFAFLHLMHPHLSREKLNELMNNMGMRL